MQTVLVTGAAGGIGTRLRQLLKGVYPNIRLSDVKRPADLAADETFVEADLASMPAVENAVAGVDGIVHLGGFSVEGPWDTILQSNIIGCYNLFEAARRHRPALKVLYTSGYTEGAILHHGRLEPGIRLLKKPFQIKSLADSVRQALDDEA